MSLRVGALVSLALALASPAVSQSRSDGVWADGLTVFLEEIGESPAARYMQQQDYGPKCEPLFEKAAEVVLQRATVEDLDALMNQTGLYYCDYTMMVPMIGEVLNNNYKSAEAISQVVFILAMSAISSQGDLSASDHFVSNAFAMWVSNEREVAIDSLCSAARFGNRTAAAIISEWPTSLPCKSSAPSKPAKPAPAPAPAKPKPAPPPVTTIPPAPPPPAPPPPVTLKPAPAPKPTPAQQGEIEAVISPVPGYTNCRRIPLDYYDPDGKLVSESMVMCQDRNGEFIEVTGAQ